MDSQHHITFGPFRLETATGRLWREGQRIPLQPKAVAVLRYLAEHPGRLVTKEELLQHVWPGTHVTSIVLRVRVREIRVALGDEAKAPRYIETIGQQGYRQLLYARLGETQRVVMHRRIGERLEKGYGRQARQRANELAVHFEAGREVGKAVRYRLLAAEIALQRYAYQETLDHCTAGLQDLAALPETPEHVQYECALQYYLGLVMVVTKGFGAPDVVHAFRRVWEVGLRVWEALHSFPSFSIILMVYLVRGELQTARDLGEQLLTWARDLNDPMALALAHGGIGYVMSLQGDLMQARQHLEQSLAYDDVALPAPLHHLPGQDPHVLALAHLSWVLWWLGYPEQALQRSQQAPGTRPPAAGQGLGAARRHEPDAAVAAAG
jgi:tetratricopeptide (TPR) repeat protein